jgi:signal transduction histidine kinase
VRPDGAVSPTPAVVTFEVLPPFYRSWWFLSTAAGLVTGLGLFAYRLRVDQLLRVERVRARIATDLHDDIGASLSQIAIQAEVARRSLGPPDTNPEAAAPLARIAETSRGLVDAMSDIVWAINPEVDTLGNLVHRMRRFVEDTLGGGETIVTFTTPEVSHDLRVGADVRREVFLILKESVTNIAKHAAARTVAIDFLLERRRLRLDVVDDGRGFDPNAGTDGNGVASMRRRVAALGGRLEIDSAPGRGTTIRLEVDLPWSSGALTGGFLPK